jgi:peptidylprolyl isomerase
VVIQLMPAPFSQGWVGNIRKLVAARWYAGVSVNRVQDNYVVQWGDANGEDAAKAKKQPDGLNLVGEHEYTIDNLVAIPDPRGRPRMNYSLAASIMRNAMIATNGRVQSVEEFMDALRANKTQPAELPEPEVGDSYSDIASLALGWPIAGSKGKSEPGRFWPVHCYGMVGVGRNLSPDTGSGAELYTVIGHAPRHLDRNTAIVGRVIDGIEHLSSLPRGTGTLGFYEKEDERVPILSVRMGNETADIPSFEYLSTDGETFARYVDARANRRDPFFNIPAGGADICNIPVPVRRRGK